MKPIQQIDKRLTEKMDAFDKIGKTESRYAITTRNGHLHYINALVWVLEPHDWLDLPLATRQRLEKLGH